MRLKITLLFMLCIFSTNTHLFSQSTSNACIPSAPAIVNGVADFSASGSFSFPDVPTGQVIELIITEGNVNVFIEICSTIPDGWEDGQFDSNLAVLDGNGPTANALQVIDDGCTNGAGPNFWGPSTGTFPATTVGTYYLYLSEWNFYDPAYDNPCIVDGVNSYTINITMTEIVCEAGSIVSPSSYTELCEDESTCIEIEGNESSSDIYFINFDNSLGGTGAIDSEYKLINLSSTDFPYCLDSGLNGLLAENGFEPMSGLWNITVGTENGQEGCDTTNMIQINFSEYQNCKDVYGIVYNDFNEDCVMNASEGALEGQIGIIEPGGIYVETNSEGVWYRDSLPLGDYTITFPSNEIWDASCSSSINFTIVDPDSTVNAGNLGLHSLIECTDPTVSIHMPFMRPCFQDQRILVMVCNDNSASAILENPSVQVELDPFIIPTNSSLPYTDLGNNLLEFYLINNLLPSACESFWIDATVDCNAVLGQTLCMEAELFPQVECNFDTIPAPPNPNITPCTLPWDKSSLSVEGYCQNDSIYFEITNTGDFGEGDMDCWAPVSIFIDGELFLFDSIQLQGGETIIYSFEGTGQTWHLLTEQHPLHPGNSNPNAFVENCGDSQNWTPDLVNIFPQDDADPIIDIYCDVVTGSYDPNDKTGYPKGVTDEHLIRPNQKMEYRIRFQNTGTDTAFTVVIRDTLETDFDIYSVQSGVASHPYSFQIYGPRVLEWTFDNILLPDSTTNEAASHGFIYFSVDQNPNLPEGTLLHNSAGIYFDYNAPIITNLTEHKIDYFLADGTTPNINIEPTNSYFEVYPNPTEKDMILDLKKTYKNVNVKITNVTGQIVFQNKFVRTDKVQLQLEQDPGIYFIEIVTNDGTSETFKIVKH